MKYYILFFCFLLLLTSCGGEVESMETEIQDFNTEVERATDVLTVYSDEGKARVEVRSPVLLHHKSRKEPATEFPEGLKVYFFDSNFDTTSTLRAKYAIRYERKQEIFIRDSVVVVNVRNEKLETEELTWNEKKQKVQSDKFVRITTDDHRIEGYGFWANQDFSVYEIDSVSGTTRINKKKFEE